ACGDHADRVLRVLGPGGKRRDLQAGVVIVELKDRDDPSVRERPVRCIDLPTLVRAAYRNRTYEVRGRFFGWAVTSPLRVKIRARVARDGEAIPSRFSSNPTEMGPWSQPAASNRARASIASVSIASDVFRGEVRGLLERGINACGRASSWMRLRVA
ncbi:hypothetical protein, partial [Microbacterium sp. A93]|uniref:hypothetical protein n=1 Tax=Microbacterium sp. A93 TaxID=3450716 RepID=UPI003F44228B